MPFKVHHERNQPLTVRPEHVEGSMSKDLSGVYVTKTTNQSRTGGGANTIREPLVSAGVTMPAASMSSIMVAARL